MTPKIPKDAISGWLILDKPVGLSSTQAMAKVRWLFNAAKAGHGGTLDPFATGVLPIAFGEATKLLSYVLDGRKSYSFTVRWGEERATDDLTGEVSQTSEMRPSKTDIENCLSAFRGTISQIPPCFSALHVNGERAYDLARRGEEVKLEPREVTIERIDLLETPNADEACFEVDCTKGTYIRSLARDMGAKLGCHGHVKVLKRLKSGPFHLESAFPLEKLEEIRQKDAGLEELQAMLFPLGSVLDDIPALSVNEQEARKLRQGQSVMLHPSRITPHVQSAATIGVRDFYGLVAMAEIADGVLKPLRVFKP
jgi:tRNA pseudouridine55 synthase